MTDTFVKRGPGRPRINDVPPPASSPALSSSPIEAMPGEPAINITPRRVRKPFGSQAQKLARPNRQGFVRHWFNDTPGRILRAKEAGWEIVLADNGEPDTHPVGVSETGGALIAFLMETPEEFYKEDQAAEQKRIDEMERSFKRGADEQGQPGMDGRYIPSRGITIRTV